MHRPRGTRILIGLLAGSMAAPAFGATAQATASVGEMTEFPVPTAKSHPMGIAAGTDQNLWFTEFGAHKIGRMTPGGVVTEFPTPTPLSSPRDITAGPDGNLWFTEVNGNGIGRITTNGVIT